MVLYSALTTLLLRGGDGVQAWIPRLEELSRPLHVLGIFIQILLYSFNAVQYLHLPETLLLVPSEQFLHSRWAASLLDALTCGRQKSLNGTELI